MPSAAIYGLRNKKDISIFILHPKGRVSPIQEAQLTTVTDANVHNVAVKGTFDDCQVSLRRCLLFYILIRHIGHCQNSLWRQRIQRKTPPRRCKLHQLGSHPRPNRVLLPLLLSPWNIKIGKKLRSNFWLYTTGST